MRVVTRMADRILELMAPHTVARAADCGWECCGPINAGRYCCYYPSGRRSCGSCQTYIYCS
ncbi:hypothetical protein GCM10010149_92730 [Nonomuraea roseoviolacea subsp. roseoviolacea]|uniref:Uncharacterized protein n=1 Tax=Nonomuraea roseoviolacea subsp. carminata TaxID=160689 RepID=A0ABT1JXZ9_9ACTN|nr:hypothetical protein [Nonomuraea roseoviolacea]MCP2346634.1 hypothetical protein [Nonomuraea roseoviolacea subsp. carminata]